MSSDEPLRVPDYLGHMLAALARIQRYTEGMDEAAFLEDEKTQDAVIRNIEIIGEAARNIERADPSFAARHSGIPLALIYRMRNKVAHGYFAVDLSVVWRTLRVDLPELSQRIRAILGTGNDDPPLA